MITALVLFGGVSSEHAVSLLSARSVIQHIPRERYAVIAVGITQEGRWLQYTGNPENLPGDRWLADEEHLTPAVLSPDRTHHGLLLFGKDSTTVQPIDVAFPVLHGKNGEDGTIQGLLELAGIPYVGCGVLSSAMCMDKQVTNTLADAMGIMQARWRAFSQEAYGESGAQLLEEAIAYLDYPVFIKPANAGSSVGVSKAKTPQELSAGIKAAFQHDCKVVLEECIVGVEVECAVIGNANPVASIVGEIAPQNKFYDYKAKYIDHNSALHIPARIVPEAQEEIRKTACRVYTAMGCSGLARVDFFVLPDGSVRFNELNTIPGFTPISLYPKLFASQGLAYPDLLDRLLCLAREK